MPSKGGGGRSLYGEVQCIMVNGHTGHQNKEKNFIYHVAIHIHHVTLVFYLNSPTSFLSESFAGNNQFTSILHIFALSLLIKSLHDQLLRPFPCEQTDTTENITSPQLVSGGNKQMTCSNSDGNSSDNRHGNGGSDVGNN